MESDLLHFNGVNGATGEYGVPEQTVEEFYTHITSRGAEEGLPDINKNVEVEKLVEAIIKTTEACFLDKASVNLHDLWLERIAAVVVERLSGHANAEAAWQFKERMRLNAAYIVRKVFEILMKGEAYFSDLTALFSEPSDEEVRKEKLKQEAVDKILSMLNTSFLAANLQVALAAQDSYRAWVEVLIADLRTLPVKPLQAMGQIKNDDKLKYSFTQQELSSEPSLPLKKLVEELEKLSSPAIDPLIEQMDRAAFDSWDDLLTALGQGLLAIPADAHNLALLNALKEWLDALWQVIAHLGTIEGVDPADINQAGWGIIFPAEWDTEKLGKIKTQLKPLLDWRKSQLDSGVYKVYEGDNGYQPDQTAAKFVARYGARVVDPVDPTKVPYYLLIVGSPEEIPFHFQYQLDVQYAVGRIDFGEDWEAYGKYARNVVAAENGEIPQKPKAVFFGVANPGDKATQASAAYLVEPLGDRFKDKKLPDWEIVSLLQNQATRANLLQNMTKETAFLFTASHGVEFSPTDPEHQRQRQGALLCQDWKGERGEIPADYYLTGGDLSAESDLSGLVAFFFACYGAGTPRYDEYAKQGQERKVIAEDAFTAALPQAMLKQGALAVIGHVERAWASSFLDRQGQYVTVFESTIERLLKGYPVGWAMEYFNTRYAALSSELTMALSIPTTRNDAAAIAEAWIANNDARGYIVIGDPAVHLPAVKDHPKTKTYVIQGESSAF